MILIRIFFVILLMSITTLNAKLILDYNFENNNISDGAGSVITDYSKSGNNGKLTAGAEIIPFGAELSEKSLKVSSNEKEYDSIVTKNSTSLSIVGNLTISLWVNPSELRESTIVSKIGNTSDNSEYALSLSHNGKIKFTDNSVDNYTYADSSSIETNKWTHIAVVRDRNTSKLTYYINGEKIEEFNWPKENGDTTDNNLVIGACDALNSPFIGKLDCIRIHNSAEDKQGIKEDMKSCNPKDILGPKIDIEKSTNGVDADTKEKAYIAKVNENIIWSYKVSNTGTEILNNIVVNDDKEGAVECPKSTLDVNESMTCQDKVGKALIAIYKNSAIATAISLDSEKNVDDSDDSYYVINIEPAIDIEKSTNYKDADSLENAYIATPYQKITWRYAVKNIGNDTITNIKVVDNQEGKVNCPKSELDAGESMACEAKNDLAKFINYENNATVEGIGLITKTKVKDEDSSHYKVDVITNLKVETYTNEKDADSEDSAYKATPNEDITWSYIIINKGSETLINIEAKDNKKGEISCPSTTLEAGKSMKCTSIKGKAINLKYENKLTVLAIGEISTKKIDAEDFSHYILNVKPEIDIEKKTNGKDADSSSNAYRAKPSETIIWSYEVKNIGTEDLYNIAVSDNKEGAVECPKDRLNIGESMTCRAKKGIANKLKYENIASVQATGLYSKQKVTDSDKSNYIVSASPKIDIEVHTNNIDADTSTGPLIPIKQSVKWEYIVTNIGDEEIIKIKVKDTRINSISCPKDSLDVNETMSCVANGVAAKGQYENIGKVSGFGILSNKSVNDSDISHYFGLNPSIDLEKHTNGKDADTSDNAYIAKPNEPITWEYILTNNGNEKLVNITIMDDKEGDVTANCPSNTLDIGKSMVCKFSGNATLEHYSNKAQVNATGDKSGIEVTDDDTSNYKVKFKAAINIQKLTNGVDTDKESIKVNVGDVIVWEYIIKNIGNEKLTNIRLVDDKEGELTSKCPSTELDSGSSMTCMLKGKATKYKYRNIAKVTAVGAYSNMQVDSEDSSGYQTNDICIGNYIWLDSNANGIQEYNEQGLAGVSVALLDTSGNAAKDINGNIVPIQKTNSEGVYRFCKIEPLKYYKIKVTPPTDYIISPSNAGDDNTKDSDINSKSGISTSIFLDKDITTVDAGLYKTSCLGGYFWNDKNADGIQGDKEEPLEGVRVNIYNKDGSSVVDAEGRAIGYINTNHTGKYKFCKLLPGNYFIKATPPSKKFNVSPKNIGNNTSNDNDFNQETHSTSIINLSSNENLLSIDGGMYESGCLGNRVWLDSNGNGIQDIGEGGISNAVVEILNTDGTPVVNTENKILGSILTKEDGYYHFCNLPIGQYTVKVTPPVGYYVTLQNVGSSESIDSDIDPKDNQSDVVKITGNIDNGSLDIGLYKPVCIGDYVWHDHNANGIQDAGDEGVAGVKLELLNKNGNKVIDINGKFVQPQVTQSNGQYKFCQLRPGDYKVRVLNTNANWHFTYKNRGNNMSDSDIDPNTGESGIISLTSGIDKNSIDIGMYKTSCIGSNIWEDLNGNGFKDKGEIAIDGAKVNIYKKDESSNTFNIATDINGKTLATTITSNNGKYRYCNLIPGSYRVEVTPPNGYKITHKYNDNRVNAHTNKTEAIIVNSGENNLKVDAGMFKPVCINGFVWEDMNANGIKDSNAVGIENVYMILTDAYGKKVQDSNFNKVKTIKTDSGGNYSFCNLLPGSYHVKMLIPKGYYLSKSSSINSDKKTNDFKPFLAKSGTTVKSKNITLTSGHSNVNIDGAVFKPACIGNYTWIDKNINGLQDKDEEPLKGVKVQILSKDGLIIKDVNHDLINEIETDENGEYAQCNLIPGSYKVKFRALNDDNNLPYISTKYVPNKANNSSIASYKKGSAVSDSATVVSGERNNNFDAGYVQEICLGDYIWRDTNSNNKKDEGEEAISDLSVKITYKDGKSVRDIYGNIVSPVKTDKDGYYKFCHLMPTIDYIIKYKKPQIQSSNNNEIINSNIDNTEDTNYKTQESKIYINNPKTDNILVHDLYNNNSVGNLYSKYVNPTVLPILGVLAIFGELYVIFRRREKEDE